MGHETLARRVVESEEMATIKPLLPQGKPPLTPPKEGEQTLSPALPLYGEGVPSGEKTPSPYVGCFIILSPSRSPRGEGYSPFQVGESIRMEITK